MVEQSHKRGLCGEYKTIVIVGLLGSGKSTVVNTILGVEAAQTSEANYGCTQEPTVYVSDLAKLNIIDTPGFGDPKVSVKTWTNAA